MKICHKCSTALKDNSKFCAKCGVPQGEVQMPPVVQNVQIPSNGYNTENSNSGVTAEHTGTELAYTVPEVKPKKKVC